MITLTVSVAAGAVPSVTNKASVATSGDTNTGNNSSSDLTTVSAAPVIDLSIVKSHTGSFTVGVNGVYSLAVTNVGNTSTTGTITVSDTLPAGLGFVSGKDSGVICSAGLQVGPCTNAEPLAATASSPITFTVTRALAA